MHKGYRFGFIGTDAKGTILSMSQTAIEYVWDHAPREICVLAKAQFLERQYPIKLGNNAITLVTLYRTAMEQVHNG